jgi:hypothetical protein
MSLYPGSPRLKDGRFVLDDAALADSMTKAIEDAMAHVFEKVKGTPIPEVGKEDRRLLYVAISRGILQYLTDHQETMRTTLAISGVPRTGPIDLNVTMDGHVPHLLLRLSPDQVAPGGSSDGTIELRDPAPAGGANVALSSNNAAVAAPAQSSVTVPEGQRTVKFKVKATPRPAPIDVTVNIRASYAGVTRTARLRVLRS